MVIHAPECPLNLNHLYASTNNAATQPHVSRTVIAFADLQRSRRSKENTRVKFMDIQMDKLNAKPKTKMLANLSLLELPLNVPQRFRQLPVQQCQQQQHEGSIHAADAVGHNALKRND